MSFTPEQRARVNARLKANNATETNSGGFTAEELAEINAVGKKQKAANMSAEDIDRLNASFDAKQETAKINAEVEQYEKFFGEKLLITPINRYNNAKESTAISCTSLCFILIAVAFFTHVMQKHGENIFKSMLRGIAFTLIPLFVFFAYVIFLQCYIMFGCIEWFGITSILTRHLFQGGFYVVFVVSFLLMLFVYKENKK